MRPAWHTGPENTEPEQGMQNLTLTGEQKRVLTLPVRHPVLIKGAAGSGKTTIALCRARHLMETDRDLFRPTRVGVISYTNALVNYARRLLDGAECVVSTLHSLAGSMLCRAGVRCEVEKRDSMLDGFVLAALRELPREAGAPRAILNKPVAFFREEIAWIKGRGLANLDAYLATARAGRGTADRVTTQDKPLIWSVLDGYNRRLQSADHVDWEDLILRALALSERPGFKPPFSHLVIDEAQDLTFAQRALVARLVEPETDSITLVADAAQCIYQSGFSWADTGLNVRGRAVEFRRNYRNTRQIAAAACSLLSHEPDRRDFTATVLPEREGPRPRLVPANSPGGQFAWLGDTLAALDREGATVAIASPNRATARGIAGALAGRGFPVRDLKSREPAPADAIVVDTLHAIKGIEFDHVFLCDLNEDTLPMDDADPESGSRLRKLLYVGMTRARQSLTLVASGSPSRLLAEIDASKLEMTEIRHA